MFRYQWVCSSLRVLQFLFDGIVLLYRTLENGEYMKTLLASVK